MLRLYKGLLHLYPAAYRQEFGEEMQWVFLQAQAEGSIGPLLRRAAFYLREVSGLLSGAAQAHFLSLFGVDDGLRHRRFKMRPQYRFPRSTVFLMWVILAGVVLAIEKARDVATARPHEVVVAWKSLPLFLLLFPALAGVAVVAIWGLLFALRRTGLHRLDGAGLAGPEVTVVTSQENSLFAAEKRLPKREN
jgi:hypothetical protein